MPTRRERSWFFGSDGPQYKKFSTENKPNKSMFQSLFNSQAFIIESDDTATTSIQGLCKLCVDTDAQDRDTTADSDEYSKVVQPHHLPKVVGDVEDVNGSGDTNNSLTITAFYNVYGRTGGSGNTFIVKNTLAITLSSPSLTFLSVTQSAAGCDTEIGADAAAFDTDVGNTTTITNIENNITDLEVKAERLGEVKMYSFFNEKPGDTNSEFNTNGVGRNSGAIGASGHWVGWVLLIGQTTSAITGATVAVINRFDSAGDGSGTLPDTKQKYPAGVDGGSVDYYGFKKPTAAANSHQLTVGETPVKSHAHGATGLTATLSGSDGGHHHNIDGKSGSGAAHRNIDTALSDGDAAKDTTTGTPPGTDEGTHDHTVTMGGDTAAATDAIASAHENRPDTFAVAFVVYVGADGAAT